MFGIFITISAEFFHFSSLLSKTFPLKAVARPHLPISLMTWYVLVGKFNQGIFRLSSGLKGSGEENLNGNGIGLPRICIVSSFLDFLLVPLVIYVRVEDHIRTNLYGRLSRVFSSNYLRFALKSFSDLRQEFVT